MRNYIGVMLGIAIMGVGLSAAAKKAQDDFSFSSDIRVGRETLKAGDYRVVCDDTSVTISRITVRTDGETYTTKVLTVPAQAKPLAEKSVHSELDMPKGPDGVQVLQDIYIEGSAVEYVIGGQ